MFLYEFAEKTAQKPDTVATYVRRNKKIFKNHVERRQKQIWLDEKAVDILMKKYPEVQKKQKKPLNKERFDEIITNLASHISSKNQCITFCVAVCIAKFDILEYLKHQNAYAIMPVGRMK